MPTQHQDNLILDTWHYISKENTSHIILPDGCQDVILKQDRSGPFTYSISPLAHSPYEVNIKKHRELVGFRLAPGTYIDQEALNRYITSTHFDDLFNTGWLGEFCLVQQSVIEILACLQSNVTSIEQAAKHLGVSPRTLQRTLKRQTNTSPHFWLSLVRARRCAKLLQKDIELKETAVMAGYSDQAHMTREFKKWFGYTPANMRKQQSVLNEINQIGGYD